MSYLQRLPDTDNKENTKRALRWAGTFLTGAPLTAIDLDLLQKMQASKASSLALRKSTPLKPGTVNRVMGVVMAVLHHAVQQKWIDYAPALEQLPNPAKVISFITRAQARKLLAELPRHQYLMVIFALETGLRRSNVTQLRWAQVDTGRRIAWVNPDEAKEGAGIPVPLSDAAIALLKLARGADDIFVFVYNGKPVKETSTRAWRLAKARAGVVPTFRWHDLRHTWAS